MAQRLDEPYPFVKAAKGDNNTIVITIPDVMGHPLSSAAHRFDNACSYPSEGVALNAIHQALKWLGYEGKLQPLTGSPEGCNVKGKTLTLPSV